MNYNAEKKMMYHLEVSICFHVLLLVVIWGNLGTAHQHVTYTSLNK